MPEPSIFFLTHADKAHKIGQARQKKAACLYRAQIITKQLETIYLELPTEKGIII